MSFAKIQNRRDFLAAAKGGRFIVNSFILQYIKRQADHPAPAGSPRVGFTVTKKIGGAVVRNRAKRRLREAVRLNALAHMKPGYDYVIIARSKAVDCEFSALLRDMEFAFSRIMNHKNAS